MKVSLLSRKYAQALMNYYHWETKEEQWIERCNAVADFLYRHRRQLVLAPIYFYRTLFDRVGLNDMPIEIILQLLEKHRRTFLLSSVLYSVVNLYKKYHAIETCVISSAVELTDEQRGQIKLFLERMSGKKLNCFYKNDNSLIAGIRAQGESFAFEDSIAQKLKKLRHLIA